MVLKVKDIIRLMSKLDSIIIWQEDVYVDGEPEQIFYGSVIDIPWYILDFYIAEPNEEGEPLSAHCYGKEYDNRSGFILYVRESEPIIELTGVGNNEKNMTGEQKHEKICDFLY